MDQTLKNRRIRAMEWYNEPPGWAVNGETITVQTGAKTDFWRTTHYGFIRDTGHFFYALRQGDFVAEVQVRGAYQDLYDQAGLMVRSDQAHWMKCGIEFVEGVQQASVVVTREYSDWSVVALEANPPAVWLRVTRRAETVEVHYALAGVPYRMLRMAYLPPTETVQVGVMCAAPDGQGFAVAFEGLSIRPLPR
jgi:regulation of enolase protein 1 (concanavalin A-like superfamily)